MNVSIFLMSAMSRSQIQGVRPAAHRRTTPESGQLRFAARRSSLLTPATRSAAHLYYCGDFCGTTKCRVLSPKDLRCHFPYEPLMLSALFVNGLGPSPADS